MDEYNKHVSTLKQWCQQDFAKNIVGWKRSMGINGGSRTVLTLVDEQLVQATSDKMKQHCKNISLPLW
eukprot:4064941-Prorocentrum_lima.AAC.1